MIDLTRCCVKPLDVEQMLSPQVDTIPVPRTRAFRRMR